jgi:antitoxin component YwqK of YwqJK toxin-antitoxin module
MTNIDMTALEISIDGEAPFFQLDHRPFTGTVSESHKGLVASRFAVVEGFKDGEEVTFETTGEIRSILQYRSGVLHGEVKHFHGGRLMELAHFDMGICLDSTEFDENNNVTNRYSVDSNMFDSTILDLRHRGS